jgi:hypothetical protein
VHADVAWRAGAAACCVLAGAYDLDGLHNEPAQ